MKSFKNFIHYLTLREQKQEICVLSIFICIIGIVFYKLYPFPFVFPDTGAYVFSAQSDTLNIYRPMGYSRYLQLLHSINSDITFVFIGSYILNAIVSLFFLYTCKYLGELKYKWLFYSICILIFLSPTILFCTNFIMSDGLFNSLTILFISTALWLIYTPNIWMVIIHIFCLALLYNIRYIGMFYVPISVIVLFWSFQRKAAALRLFMICVPIVVFFFIQNSTREEYKKITGVNTTSGFSGWQLMNNASVLIPTAKKIPINEFSHGLEQLYHRYLMTCPDTIFTTKAALSTGLMWDKNSPFKQFVYHYMQMSNQPYALAWVETGELYSKYSKKIIFSYPFDFTFHYIIPSFISFFEFKEIGEHTNEFKNEPIYQDFYGIKMESYKHTCNLFTDINPLRHVLHYIYWISLIVAAAFFIIKTKTNDFSSKNWQLSFLLLLFIFIYIGTSTLASPNTTWRYAMPIYVPSIIFIGSIINGLSTRDFPINSLSINNQSAKSKP